jgi:hypothetical protein
MTSGLAPGYIARTTTVGGTTSGYSLIGKSLSETAPAMKMIADRTPAKIGRFTKNCEKPMTVLLMCVAREARFGVGLLGDEEAVELGRAAVHGHLRGRHRHARAHALQTVDDDSITRREATFHDAHPRDEPTRFDRAIEALEGAFDVAGPESAAYDPSPLLIDRVD